MYGYANKVVGVKSLQSLHYHNATWTKLAPQASVVLHNHAFMWQNAHYVTRNVGVVDGSLVIVAIHLANAKHHIGSPRSVATFYGNAYGSGFALGEWSIKMNAERALTLLFIEVVKGVVKVGYGLRALI